MPQPHRRCRVPVLCVGCPPPSVAADLPKVLRFKAKLSENRREIMEAFLAGEGNLDEATGIVELYSEGVPFGKIPFVHALFGRLV